VSDPLDAAASPAREAAPPAAPPEVGAYVADPWGLVLAGLIAVRVMLTGHAPNVVDAAIAGGFALLLLRAAVIGRGVDRVAMAAVGGALIVAMLSAVASVHPLMSAWAVPGFLAPLLAFAAVRSEDMRSRQRVAVALALAGILHAVVALYQRFVSYPDALARADTLRLDPDTVALLSHLRPLGLALSPDLAGGLALVTACVGLVLLLGRADPGGQRDATYRLLGALALVLGLGAVIASRSAGTALALLVAAAVFGVAARGGGALSTRALVGMSAVAVVSAAAAFRGLAALSASASERLANWSTAFELGLTHPLGVGLARFGPVYLSTRAPESNITQYAHSAWLHVWAELGLPGAALLVALAVVSVRSLLRLSTQERQQRALWLAALAALMTRASIDYDLQVGQCAVVAGAVAGLTLPRRDDATALSRARAAQLLVLVLTLVCLLPLLDLVPRERALTPFERGGDERQQNMGQLLRFADAHPGDVVANTVAARIEVVTLRSCRDGPACAAVERRLRRRVDLADDLAPADGLHLAAAQLALLRGDLVIAEAETRAALDDHRGSLSAWRTLVDLARLGGTPGAAAAVVAEAKPWLVPMQHEVLRVHAQAPIAPTPPDGEGPAR
jgi:O-antigen ligase